MCESAESYEQPIGITREQFFASEGGEAFIQQWRLCEDVYGPIQRAIVAELPDGRRVGIILFTQVFFCRFFNPANTPEEQRVEICLSHESLYVLLVLASGVLGKAGWEALQERVEALMGGEGA